MWRDTEEACYYRQLFAQLHLTHEPQREGTVGVKEFVHPPSPGAGTEAAVAAQSELWICSTEGGECEPAHTEEKQLIHYSYSQLNTDLLISTMTSQKP